MATLASLWMAHASGIAVAVGQGTKSYTIHSPHGEHMPGSCIIGSLPQADHSARPDLQLPTHTTGLAVRDQHQAAYVVEGGNQSRRA